MPIVISGKLVIPYGSASIRSDVLERSSRGAVEDLERPGAPVAVIDPSAAQPLRFNSILHPFTLPPVAQDLAHADSQLTFLENHLVRLCGEWAKPRQLLIDRYFAAIRSQVRANERSLAERAEALSGLVELDHWCFSALLPLPRAHLLCTLPKSKPVCQPSDFVPVDAAFWTGHDLAAVIVDDGSTPTGQRKRGLERLRDSGAQLITVDKAELNASGGTQLLHLLGEQFANFLSEQSLPVSPFRGREIDPPLLQSGANFTV